MRKISVEMDQLLSCADRMDNTNQDYLQKVNEFFNTVDGMASAWRGKDNIAFTSKISKFNGDFKALSLLCSQYADFLRNSARAYNETQNELTEQIGQLQI